MVAEMYFSSFRDIQKDLRDFLSCRLRNYASLLRDKGIHRLGLLLSFKKCLEPEYFVRSVSKKNLQVKYITLASGIDVGQGIIWQKE